MQYTNVDRAAAYLSLLGAEQVDEIINTALGNSAALRAAYEDVRRQPGAAPAVLALATSGRIADEDIRHMMGGIGYMFYASMKRAWNAKEYEQALVTLFGLKESRAAEYAKEIETPESEGMLSFTARMAKKFGDLMLGPLWDPNTVKQDGDLPWELVQFGQIAAKVAKQVIYAAAPFEGLSAQTVSMVTQTGEAREIGDIETIPDHGVKVMVDAEKLAKYLESFMAHYAPSPLPIAEQGGAKRRRRKPGWFSKALSGIKKLAAPVLSTALKMTPLGPIASVAEGIAKAGPYLHGDVLKFDHPDAIRLMSTSVSALLQHGEVDVGDPHYHEIPAGRTSEEIPSGEVFLPGANVRPDAKDPMSLGPRIDSEAAFE